jgi:hypothetical protein
MPGNERGGLKAAFSNFNRDPEKEAELKLLGRIVESPAPEPPAKPEPAQTYPAAAAQPVGASGLTPRPLLQREPVRQLSFRCPVTLASELRRKAAFNQLEQQQIIVEGIKRVMAELPDPPEGWQE